MQRGFSEEGDESTLAGGGSTVTWFPSGHTTCDKETQGSVVWVTAELIYLRLKIGAFSAAGG